MERPLSAASGATAPNQYQHRRHASSIKSATGRPPVSSNSTTTTISLFLSNLRLLDLDLNQDWPNITTSSFSNQDSRTKIKCSEYALYQLFRLYDPATTSDKLQPFFPPLEPLQSVNLRAALYRCLNDLKRSGLLPKDTILRKTMLDECNGEKFWELCLNFSTLVLRNQSTEKQSRRRRTRYPSIAEQIGTAQAVNKSEKESMLPLAIAHRASLAKILEEKQRKRETYRRLQRLLAEKQGELVQRKQRSEESVRGTNQTQHEQLHTVEATIAKSWIGSTDLRDALIDGDTCPKGDGLLVKSFDHVWNEGIDLDGRDSGGAEVGLLQSLNDKTLEQAARLRRWQHFHDQLVASKPLPAKTGRPTSQAQKPSISFSRHRDINLHDSPDDQDEPEQKNPPQIRNDSATRYDDILTAMREELRKNSIEHRNRPVASPVQPSFHGAVRRSQTQPIAPVRKMNVAIDTNVGAQNGHIRSPSQTTVPLRSPMGRRVSSRSRSYDKPKVDGMREPIPLKAELFSPLRESRRSSLSPTSLLSSSAEVPEPDAEDAEPYKVNGIDEQIEKEAEEDLAGKSPASPRDSGLGMHTDGFAKPVIPGAEAAESSGSEAEPKTQAPPIAIRQSLAERTRKSMAFTRNDHMIDEANESPSNSPSPSPSSPANDDSDSTELPAFDRRATLLERTRQSISLAPPASALSKKPSHTRSRTSTFPVNQFETPQKSRRSTIGLREKRDATPIEALMSPEAEYDSVFKSRPKIALSPVLSPSHPDDSDL